MARSLLLSLLVRQSMALKERFRARYPHPWLVWEAGAWNVPETEQRQNVAATQFPAPDLRDCLPAGDALCFELVTLGPVSSSLSLGRSSSNALVINDATVSREHLALHGAPNGQWSVEAQPKASPVKLDGVLLQPGQPVVLVPGARLELGDVRLTFHDPEGFFLRLGQLAEQLTAQMNAAPARAG
ncbi:FHA domain-containing protein [Hyalangium rubrum]|uniref:FHA domain-containing protein n=1 Tax=Hyalangium rubrum TaxID=3103134 RepID=A0ABU5HFD4_9BACT|nr:FHA domain-containing protein [Hyalangium sp. s54d21]MDY7232191.1 FHA domain-containing protein [Hyalangium sp. s54d21]